MLNQFFTTNIYGTNEGIFESLIVNLLEVTYKKQGEYLGVQSVLKNAENSKL